jgi:hypothetical protein
MQGSSCFLLNEYDYGWKLNLQNSTSPLLTLVRQH